MSDKRSDQELPPHTEAGPADPSGEDPELRSLLRQWGAPEVSATLDERIMSAYSRRINPAPWWAPTTVRLPFRTVALAAAVLLCSLTSIGLVLQTPPDGRPERRRVAGAIRPDELPIVQEIALEDFEGETRYFTYINLSGFQPAEAIKVRIIKRSHADEN